MFSNIYVVLSGEQEKKSIIHVKPVPCDHCLPIGDPRDCFSSIAQTHPHDGFL